MKELSIEEKAKRYDKALVIAKSRYSIETEESVRICLELMFPELKESEDEKIKNNNYEVYTELIERLEGVKTAIKNQNYGIAMDILCKLYPCYKVVPTTVVKSEDERIRKEIIAFLTYYHTGQGNSMKYDDGWIAWLEKQGEQKEEKPISEHDTWVNDPVISFVNVQGDQKPADKVEQKGMNIVEEDMTPFQKKVFCIIDTTIEEEQGLKQVCDELLRLAHDEIMQKPAWSEEDDKIIETMCKEGDLKPSEMQWLKSLKDRVQPKQEWSDVDKDILFRTIDNLKFLRDTISIDPKYAVNIIDIEREITWIKSLKDRYTWKPSKAQIKAVKDAIEFLGCTKKVREDLKSLREQLKKLRGE